MISVARPRRGQQRKSAWLLLALAATILALISLAGLLL